MSEHDPFNESDKYAHKRARELMTDPMLWNCSDESAPFGSDEGYDAYYEWRNWREENPTSPLTECLDWICDGKLSKYTMEIATNEQVAIDIATPDGAFLADHFDIFTLDTTIIATGLGQLVDEGSIDTDAKQFLNVAIQRQRNLSIGHYDKVTLDAIARVIHAA